MQRDRLRKRILIAGAGYLGVRFAELLARSPAEYEVYLARRTPVKLGFKTIACDFSDPNTLSGLPEVDAIFYAVAADGPTDLAYEKAYSLGVKNLVDHYLSRSLKPRFYFSSSTSVYRAKSGEIVTEATHELATEGPSRFIVEGESYLLKSGLSGAVLRYGGIYGPGRTRFLERIRDGLELQTPHSVQYMNRIHRDDAAAIVKFLLGLESEEMIIVNAVDREPSQRDDVIRWVLAEWGIEEDLYAKDRTVLSAKNNKRVDSAKLRQLGYHYNYPSFREGYKALIAGLMV